MNKPELLGLEVITPDGKGTIFSLHKGCIAIFLNRLKLNHKMIGRKGRKGDGELIYKYSYRDVELIND